MEDKNEIDIFAKTLYGEARGEGLIGIEAVASVILNRVLIAKTYPVWWGKTISEVCLKPLQFSCWNVEDKNFQKVLNVRETDEVFQLCKRVAIRAMNGFLKDATKGATHYHTKQTNPAWARKLVPTYECGNHLFYREIPQ